MSTTTFPETEQVTTKPQDVAQLAQVAQRATPEEVENRLALISGWLVEGKTRGEVQRAIMETMFVSLRSAQQYVRVAQRRLAMDAAAQEELYYLRLSQHQRDEILAQVLNYTRAATQVDPKVLKSVSTIALAASKLLDARNTTARQIHALLAADAGPDSLRELHAELKRLGEESDRRRQEDAAAARAAPARAKAAPRGVDSAENPHPRDTRETPTEKLRRRPVHTPSANPKGAPAPTRPGGAPWPTIDDETLVRQLVGEDDARIFLNVVPPEQKSMSGKGMGQTSG